MRRQFLSMVITGVAFSLVSLAACGSTSVNVGSTKAPEPATTPASSEKQVQEVKSVPQKTEAPKPEPVIPQAQHATQSNRAEEVLRQAREALGGEAKLKEIQNLTVSGSFRRVSNGQEQSGEQRMDLLLPDRLKISQTISLIAGMELIMVNALNGDQAWTDSHTNAGNAQVMMVRPGNEQQNNEERARRLRAELTRYMLALFLTPPTNASVEFGGEAEATDGRADVLILKEANAAVARLFVDQKTHRPLMMTYRDVAVGMKTMKSNAGGTGDVDKIVKDAQSNARVRKESDMQMRFSDYKPEKGILLPHLISVTVEDKPYEEWELKSFKVNSPDLTEKKFEKGE
jgi:hypothetical protein